MRLSRPVSALCVAVMLQAGLPVPTGAQAAPTLTGAAAQTAAADPGPASYAYDAAGRLAGVVSADGSVARYSYDAAGNVLGIERLGAPPVAVLSAVPSRVLVGDRVRVHGSGFETSPGDNSVTVNGVSAPVLSATGRELVITVPTGATTGPLQVSTPAGSASLPALTVLEENRPAITGFTPQTAVAGATVTLSVANPDPDFANNLVRINGLLSTVTAVTEDTVTVTVPAGIGSGRVQFATPAGTATSTDVLIIVPGGVAPAAVDTVGAIALDTPVTVPVAAGKHALRYLDAEDGDRFALSFSGGTFGGCGMGAKFFDERNRQVSAGSCVGTSGWVEPSPVSGAGLRTLMLHNSSANAGTTTVTVHRVPEDLDAGAQPMDGTPKTVTVEHPGRNAHTTFAGEAGDRVIVQATGTSGSFAWQVNAPDGTRVGLARSGNTTQDTVILPQSGTYRVHVNPSTSVTGSITIAAWAVAPDLNAGPQPMDGTPKTVTVTDPGRDAYTTFTAAEGDRVIVQATGTTTAFAWQLNAPDGTRVGLARSGNSILDTSLLLQSGTYRLFANPSGTTTGPITLSAWAVPADLDAGAQPLDGTPKTVTVTDPGRDAHTTFTAAEGDRVILQTTGATSGFSPTWQVIAPNGTAVGTTRTGNALHDTTALPQTGAYRVFLNPAGVTTGSITIAAWAVPADLDAGAQPLDGTPKTVTVTNPGRNAHTTFTGAAGDRVIVQTTGTSTGYAVNWQLDAPDGTRVGAARSGNSTLDTVVLPQTGTYRVSINPTGTSTGSITVAVWAIPPDFDAGPQPMDGAPKTVALTEPGRDGYTTFTAGQGERVIIQTTGTSGGFSVTWQLTAPDGTRVGAAKSGNAVLDTTVLPQTGTYRIAFAPATTSTGSITVAAWAVPEDLDAGSQPMDGTPKTVTIGDPGRDGHTTFDADQGDRVIVQTTGTSTGYSVSWQVTAPDGTRVGAGRSGNAILDTVVLPQDGTYRLSLAPTLTSTGSITIAAWAVAEDLDAGTQPLDGTAKTVTIGDPGRDGYTTFEATEGDRVLVRTTGITTGFTLGWQLTAPDGTRVGSSLTGNSTLDTVVLPQTGTYRVSLNPTTTTTGSIDVAAWAVPADVDAGAQALDGTAKTVAIAVPGQSGHTTFTGAEGDRVIIQTSGTTTGFTVPWQLNAPNGVRVGSALSGNAILDTVVLPQTGTYRVFFNPSGVTTGSITVAAWAVADDLDAGAQPLDGTAKTLTIPNPGRSGHTTFEAAEGDRVLIQTTGATTGFTVPWQLNAPNGVRVGTAMSGNALLDTVVLPQTGTYRIFFNPSGVTTGSITVAAWAVPEDLDAGVQALDGAARTVTIPDRGRSGYTTFTGAEGDRVIIQTSGATSGFTVPWQLNAPNGARVGAAMSGNALLDTVVLPQTGTYRIFFNPSSTTTGSITVAAWAVAEDVDGGVQALDGAARTVTIPDRGRSGYTTFEGATGDRVIIQTTGATTGFTVPWQLNAPNGTRVGSAMSGNAILDTVVLPQTGTYRIFFNPSGVTTGSITVAAWSVPEDLDAGPQALNGTARTVTIANPGRSGHTTFEAAEGSRVIIQTSGTTTGFTVPWQLNAPNGVRVGSALSGNAILDTVVLPQTGTYRVFFNPSGVTTGSITVAAWAVADDLDAGPLPLDGTDKPVAMSDPGRSVFAPFEGTAGQRVVVRAAATSMGTSLSWSVRGPTGAQVGATRAGNATLDVTLPATGAYRVLLNPAGTLVGTTTLSATVTGVAPATQQGALAVQQEAPAVQQDTPPPATAERPAARGPDRIPAAPPGKVSPDPLRSHTADLLAKSGNGKETPDHPRSTHTPAPAAPADPAAEAATSPDWTPDGGNLAGADWLTRRAEPAAVSNLTAPAGVTAVSGHVRDLNGRPLAGIPVRAGEVRTSTDARGRFLLAGVLSTTSHVTVDGYAANRGQGRYGTFRVRVKPAAGRTTPLDATVWLPKLDLRTSVRIGSPTAGETVLTTPDIPGLEVRVPAGSVVRDLDGHVVRELSLTAVPLDRPPFPLPRNGIVPSYFTVQPGGATIFPDGASVVYPNYTDLPAGTVVDFWHYDPVEKGWHVYGKGSVSEDATRVVPDERTRLWALDGAMFNTPGNPEPDDDWLDDLIDKLSGDPVDLSTGLLTDSHTDLGVVDTLPITLTRTYWQGDGNEREFGRNSAAEFNMFLTSAQQYQEVDLRLPAGGKVHYTRTSPGTGYSDAVFGAEGASGRFAGSTIAQVSGDWVLTLRDGTKFFFPWYARVRAIQDRNGNQVTFLRNNGSNGEVSQVISPNGRWISFEYDSSDRVTRARDNIGRTTGYTYDAAGRLATVVDVSGGTTTYTYDAQHRVTRITDPRGVAYLEVTYDAAGRVAGQTLAGGGTYSFAYTTNAADLITETRVTQPNGAVRRVVFNPDRTVLSDTQAHGTPLARTATYERGQDNRIDAVVNPYGERTEYDYDAENRPVAVTELAGTANATVVGRTTYGPFGNPASTTDAAGRTTTYTYDAKGNLTSYTDPIGRTAAIARTSTGQVASSTDPTGAVTRFAYEAGALVRAEDPLGRVSRTFVDAAGRPVAATDPAGSALITRYDAANRVTAITDPLGHVQGFAYDPNGNLTSFTDARGKVTTWTYDPADRPAARTDPLGRTSTVAYDPAGRTTETVSRTGKRTAFAYDALDRVTSVRYGVSGATAQSQVTYGYNGDDRLSTLTDTAGGSVALAYDARGRVVGETGPHGTVTHGHDAVGRQTSTGLPGQPATAYAYDAAGRPTGISRGTESVAFTRDAAGRPTEISLPGGWTQAQTYDAAGQLTAVEYRQGGAVRGGLTYTYDLAGRRASVGGDLANVTLPQARSDLDHDDANRLVSAGGTALSYDHDGNLLGDGTKSYTWDARGRLSGTSAAGLTAAYAYDALGNRTGRTVGGMTTGFLADGPNQALELDGAGGTRAALLGGAVDQWFARTADGVTDTVLADGLGSPVALGRADGTLAANYAYDPFGGASLTGDARGADLSFTGRQDDGTGLMYYRDRYYSPALQRFISEDPSGIAGGANLYAYAGNAPTTFVDPSGNNPLVIGCLVGGAIGGGAAYLGDLLGGRKVDWGGVGMGALGGCAMGALGGWLGGLGRGAGAADDVMANARNLGRQGEQLAGINQAAKTRIPSLTGTANHRVPDALTNTTLTEVKNVANQGMTNQIRDYIAYSQAKGLQFDLVVRHGTNLTGPLQNAVNSGAVNLIRKLP